MLQNVKKELYTTWCVAGSQREERLRSCLVVVNEVILCPLHSDYGLVISVDDMVDFPSKSTFPIKLNESPTDM